MKKRRGRFRIFRHIQHSPIKFLLRSSVSRWVVLIAIVGSFYFLITSSLLRISEIECVNVKDVSCDPPIIAELNQHQGELTFLVNVVEIESKIQKANPQYSNVSVMASLPNKLYLHMGEKLPFANIKSSSSSAILVIDDSYEILDISQNEIAGIFTLVSPLISQVGIGDQIADHTTLQAISIADELKKSYIYIKKMQIINPTEILVELFDGKFATFSSTGDIPRQVTSLQLILSKATISPEPHVIDVRFDMPVLKY